MYNMLMNKNIIKKIIKSFNDKRIIYFKYQTNLGVGAARNIALDKMQGDYFIFLEETDWCYRMKRAGWKIYHIPQAQVFHFQGKSAETVKKRARVEFYRSRYHLFKKNRGHLQWFLQ